MRRDTARTALALAVLAAIVGLLPARDGVSAWSLFPPLAAIVAAVASGRLLLGLSLAVASGAVIATIGTAPLPLLPLVALRRAALDFVWAPLRQSFQLYILGFTATLIGMVRVIARAGGTQGIAELLVRRAAGPRSARLATAALGLAIFFDDYANTLVVGTTMRPICDRFRVSREKLAYLVDSTAAPVAGLAVISTWIGYEVGLLDDAMRQVGAGVSGYELFFRALPARFYCLFTLLFVVAGTAWQRDFGPMLRAERRALATGQVLAAGARPLVGAAGRETEPHPDLVGHWAVAVAPVLLVIAGVLGGMHLDAWGDPEVTGARALGGVWSQRYWTAAFAAADGPKVMFAAAMAGSALAIALACTRRTAAGTRPLRLGAVLRLWSQGVTGFHYALAILVLAWAIKETCTAVRTSDYLVALLAGSLRPSLLPLIVFLLAAAVSFAIGTSWTTMAILLPTMLPVAWRMGALPLAVLVAAAVLDGAIFGDHCSPISDTTVLSSIASSCDHLAHVRTQLVYAVTTMAVAALCGYLGVALLYPRWAGLALGALAVVGVLRVWGRDPAGATSAAGRPAPPR